MPEEHDIGAELYELIRADFERFLDEESPELPDMSVANMKQADSYAHLVGRCLALAIAEHVKPEALPDGRLYYNIAEKILDPSLRENHRLVNEFCGEIQELINERQGIHITPQAAKYPEERAHALINAAAHEEDWSKTERILDDSVRTLTDSFYADNVKANADLRSKAGLKTYIVREGGSKCCPWCADLVGRYAYPDEVPKDVYRRHDNCTCSVTYVNGRGRQNVWSKQFWSAEQEREYLHLRDEMKAQRLTAFPEGAKDKPVRLSKKEIQAIMERVGGLTFKGSNDKIILSDSSSIYDFVTADAANKVPYLSIFTSLKETDPKKKTKNIVMDVLHKQASVNLLRYIRNDELFCLSINPNYQPGFEYSIVYDADMKPIKGREKPQKYEQGKCKIESPGELFHAFHNHGSSETLGFTDIDGFSSQDKMLSITAQGNNGQSKFTLLKTAKYDKYGYYDFISTKSKEPFFYAGERQITLEDCGNEARKEEIKAIYANLSSTEQALFRKALVDKTEECLKGGEIYGVKYYSSKT